MQPRACIFAYTTAFCLDVELNDSSSGNPLQYSCLENPMDRGAWQASLYGRKESDMTERLSTHTTQKTQVQLDIAPAKDCP